MSLNKPLLITMTILTAGLIFQACNKGGEGVTWAIWRKTVKQPLAFDHAAHIKAEDMECTDCHKFANKGAYATLPKLKDCEDCHSQPQGKSPDEPKVREYLEEGKEIPWSIVNKLSGDVYFSHRDHVVFGKMKCWDCHRDMRKVSKPVTEPDVGYLTMSKCIACHKQKQAEIECSTCHK